jgi:hypothetical protein
LLFNIIILYIISYLIFIILGHVIVPTSFLKIQIKIG